MKKRPLLVKVHTWMGLLALIPLLISCLTGILLVFKYEIDTLLRGDVVQLEPGTERRNLDELRVLVEREFPDHEISGWVLFQQPEKADVVYLIAHGEHQWQHIYVDGYRAQILSQPAHSTSYFTDWLLELHYTLLLDHAGLLISGIASLMLFLLGATGLFIYRQFWKNIMQLRWRAAKTTFYVDSHSSFGALFSPVLLILGFTGAYWNILHVAEEGLIHDDSAEYRMVEQLYGEQLSFQQLLQRAESSIDGFDATYVSFPYNPQRPIVFFGDVYSPNPLLSQYASQVTFDARSGELLDSRDIRKQGVLAKVDDSFRRLHFGDFGGLPVKLIWSAAGVIALWLGYTGLSVWLTKRAAKRRAQRKKQRYGSAGQNALADSQDAASLNG